MANKTLFLNGDFYSYDNENTIQAIASDNGIITAMGSNTDLRPLKRRGYELVDLKKKFVVPGFIDSHLHLLSLGMSFDRVNLDGVDSLEKVTAILKKAAAKLSKDQWLLGRGWNKNLWGDKFPDKSILDNITDNPVVLGSKDGHLTWVNSTALKYFNIDRSTPDPEGGVIEKVTNGEPTGILKETAADICYEKIPPPPREYMIESIKQAQKHLIKLGIVAVGDCDERADLFSIYHDLDQSRKLKIRIFKMVPRDQLQRAIDFKFTTGQGTDHFRIGDLKLFADGALGSQTAYMFEPYIGSTDNYGVETLTPAQIDDYVSRAVEASIGVAMHAIGDKACYQALNGIGKYSEQFKAKGLRPRVEHAQLLRESEIPLFKKYGIIPSMQPIHATSDRDTADKYWGVRSRYAYAFKSLLKSGAKLAFGSDAPIETANPMAGMHAAVARKRANEPTRPSWYSQEKITLSLALKAYTVGAAYACHFDGIIGELSIGRKADFAVLSNHIFDIDPNKLHKTEVAMTVIDGDIVYEAK